MLKKRKEKPDITPNQLLITNTVIHSGPSIGFSEKFPSSLSPIKPFPEDNDDKSSLMDISQSSKVLGEDPSTKKLLDFIRKLEKGPVTDVTLAERMNQLSFLLKNSSMNAGAKSDAEEPAARQQTEAQSINKKDEQLIPRSLSVNKISDHSIKTALNEPNIALVGSKKPETKSSRASNTAAKTKSKNAAHSIASNPRTVHVRNLLI